MSALPVPASPLGSPDALLAKAQAFKEIGALVSTGFFPDGLKTVQQVVAICWMADALDVHPMLAVQDCYVVGGKVGFGWRFKWALVQRHLPRAGFEVLSQDDQHCTVRFWRDAATGTGTKPVDVTVTREQLKKAGRFTNALYESSWTDMSFKSCMHRGIDQIASDAVRGMPAVSLPDPPAGAPPAKEPSTAAVIEEGAAAFAAEEAVVQATPAAVSNVDPQRPAAPPDPQPAVTDWSAELAKHIDRVFNGGRKMAGPKRLEKASLILTQMRGQEVTLKPGRVLAPSEAHEALEWLLKKHPSGGEAVQAAAENGKAGASWSPAGTGPDGGTAAAEPPVEVKNFDEQHADATMEAPVPLEAEEEPIPTDPEDPQDAENEAAARAIWEADGRASTLLAYAAAGKKRVQGRTFAKEAPPGSKAWYFVDMPIMQQRGHTAGICIQKDGVQVIDPEECRALIALMREAGVEIVR